MTIAAAIAPSRLITGDDEFASKRRAGDSILRETRGAPSLYAGMLSCRLMKSTVAQRTSVKVSSSEKRRRDDWLHSFITFPLILALLPISKRCRIGLCQRSDTIRLAGGLRYGMRGLKDRTSCCVRYKNHNGWKRFNIILRSYEPELPLS
jgi:hypothetical protein